MFGFVYLQSTYVNVYLLENELFTSAVQRKQALKRLGAAAIDCISSAGCCMTEQSLFAYIVHCNIFLSKA